MLLDTPPAALDGATLWIEGEDSAIKFGPDADTDLFRGGANDLRTSGDFTAANIHVTAADGQGLVDGVRVSQLKADHDELDASAVKWEPDGGLKLGGDDSACGDAKAATLRWNAADNAINVCARSRLRYVLH